MRVVGTMTFITEAKVCIHSPISLCYLTYLLFTLSKSLHETWTHFRLRNSLGKFLQKLRVRSFAPLLHGFNLLKTHNISGDSSGGKARGLDPHPTVHREAVRMNDTGARRTAATSCTKDIYNSMSTQCVHPLYDIPPLLESLQRQATLVQTLGANIPPSAGTVLGVIAVAVGWVSYTQPCYLRSYSFSPTQWRRPFKC